MEPVKGKIIPETDRKIVGLREFKGDIILATDRGVYRLEGDVFVPIKFVDEKAND